MIGNSSPCLDRGEERQNELSAQLNGARKSILFTYRNDGFGRYVARRMGHASCWKDRGQNTVDGSDLDSSGWKAPCLCLSSVKAFGPLVDSEVLLAEAQSLHFVV